MFATGAMVQAKSGKLNEEDLRCVFECVYLGLFVPGGNSMLYVTSDETLGRAKSEDVSLASRRFVRQVSNGDSGPPPQSGRKPSQLGQQK